MAGALEAISSFHPEEASPAELGMVSYSKFASGPVSMLLTGSGQRVEALIRCGVLNRMTGLGMPESVRI